MRVLHSRSLQSTGVCDIKRFGGIVPVCIIQKQFEPNVVWIYKAVKIFKVYCVGKGRKKRTREHEIKGETQTSFNASLGEFQVIRYPRVFLTAKRRALTLTDNAWDDIWDIDSFRVGLRNKRTRVCTLITCLGISVRPKRTYPSELPSYKRDSSCGSKSSHRWSKRATKRFGAKPLSTWTKCWSYIPTKRHSIHRPDLTGRIRPKKISSQTGQHSHSHKRILSLRVLDATKRTNSDANVSSIKIEVTPTSIVSQDEQGNLSGVRTNDADLK